MVATEEEIELYWLSVVAFRSVIVEIVVPNSVLLCGYEVLKCGSATHASVHLKSIGNSKLDESVSYFHVFYKNCHSINFFL